MILPEQGLFPVVTVKALIRRKPLTDGARVLRSLGTFGAQYLIATRKPRGLGRDSPRAAAGLHSYLTTHMLRARKIVIERGRAASHRHSAKVLSIASSFMTFSLFRDVLK
jgi:hypothetical protein